MKTKKSVLILVILTKVSFAQEIYMGQSKNKMPHGFGVLDFDDGSYYQGMYQFGIPNGPGTFCDAKGNKQTGIFRNGEYFDDVEVVPNTKLMDMRFYADSVIEFQSMQMDIEFSNKAPKKNQMIVAPFGSFRLNGQEVSAGFITNTQGYTHPKHEKKGQNPIELETAVFLKTYRERRRQMMMPIKHFGFCESGSNDGTNQGEFVSVLRNFDWQKGQRYTMLISRNGYTKYKDSIYSIVSLDLYIHEEDTVVKYPIGSIAILGSTLYLQPQQALTVSTHTRRCFLGKIPYMEFKVLNFFINQQPQSFEDSRCSFDYQTPQYALADLVDDYSAAVFSIGDVFKLVSGSFHDENYFSYFEYNEVFEENE
jgi:hypothetical protein